jgi:hypothetical protein
MKLISGVLVTLLMLTSIATASPRYTAAKQAAERVRKSEREFDKRFNKLTDAEKKRLKASFRSADSDDDGVSDIIEGAIGSDRCDKDSDDDGFDDSNDGAENTPGNDDDSSDDSDSPPNGGDDSNEVEIKGTIDSFVDPVLDVKDRSFTVTEDTVFRGRDFGRDDLDNGVCVEVKGLQRNGTLVAVRIKRESPDECR